MDDKLKTLKPMIAGKKRYLSFEIISESSVEFADFVNVFWNSSMSFIGELGSAKASIWIVKDLWDQKLQKGVIKCSHAFVEKIRLILSLIGRIGDQRVIVSVLGVSGTLNSAKAKIMSMRDLASYN
ncbi:MAG: ribonuclease P protein component 2 [Candidatus Aenigmarchaeota archaeon]|nr:ribonuclease P protein component 2 [Candidatus Aenigmarchaeota archaeon]